jgi:AcrR family transcriptional regulator
MSEPAYSRMNVDERRRQLLDLGAELFARNAYDELSMAAIAREAGISKALLYHYFPSKSDYFQATVAAAAEDVARRTTPDPDLPPLQALTASLDAFLAWIEQNEMAYRKLMQGATGAAEVRDLVAGVREQTAQRLLGGLADGEPSPAVRTAVHGWLGYMDAACLDWLEHRDMNREELRNLLLGSLLGALTAAGFTPELD